MPTYHRYSEQRTNGTPMDPKAQLKNMGGLTTSEKIIALWKSTDLSYTEIGRLVGISRSGVSGAVQRYKVQHMGYVPTKRGYYINKNRPSKDRPLYGYGKYTPFSHAADSALEEERRNKLRKALR